MFSQDQEIRRLSFLLGLAERLQSVNSVKEIGQYALKYLVENMGAAFGDIKLISGQGDRREANMLTNGMSSEFIATHGQPAVDEMELRRFDESLARIFMPSTDPMTDEARLQDREPGSSRRVGYAGVATKGADIQLTGRAGGGQLEESGEGFEIGDVQHLPYIALDISRSVVTEPGARIELAIEDSWIGSLEKN